ncbi:MAG: hypothetical protein IJ449_11705 [Clostridia bacterium]|nr:hypothetical protein [Clostridia bacterium]
MTALISAGGYDFPEPSTYDANISTIVDTGRNVNGYVVGSIVRSDVAKISVSWRYLTVEEWSAVLSVFSKSFYNNVTFFNPVSGGYDTRKMYVSDRPSAMFRRDPKTGEVVGWKDCSLSLVEV